MKKSVVDLKEKVEEGENILRKTQFDLEEKIAGLCIIVVVVCFDIIQLTDQQHIIEELKEKLNKPSLEQVRFLC